MSQPATKQRILDAAELLFGEKGFDATSLREITGRAGVNLAAVNYHFGSKVDLFRAVLDRHLVPLARERFARLDKVEAEARASASPPRLEAIIEAFIGPVLPLFYGAEASRRESFLRLMGRVMAEPDTEIMETFHVQIAATAERFFAALSAALPSLPPEEVMWRLHFMVGVMVHAMIGRDKLRRVTICPLNVDDVEGTIARMVVFIAAGMRAPAPRPAAGREAR